MNFTSQCSDQARMPVALLSGFLGSGKTTLVNALLRDPRMADTAVAVNEFGEIPLDHELIDHGADRTVVMANGCLCCNLAGDMDEAVLRLFSRRQDGSVPHFARLIIEPSGLADPAPIAQAILRNPVMARAFRLEAIVTTVDACFAEAQLARHSETRKQIALADRLVLTKPDLAGPEAVARVRAALRRLNQTAPIQLAEHGAVEAASLFPPSFFAPTDDPSPRRSFLMADAGETAHDAAIGTVSLATDQALDWDDVEAWLKTIRLGHGAALLRVKAMLNLGGPGPVVLHGVHHVLHAPVQMEAWPSADRRSRLVLIADENVCGAIRASWQAALPGMILRTTKEA